MQKREKISIMACRSSLSTAESSKNQIYRIRIFLYEINRFVRGCRCFENSEFTYTNTFHIAIFLLSERRLKQDGVLRRGIACSADRNSAAFAQA